MKINKMVLAFALCVSMAFTFTGCKSIPSTDQMYLTSQTIGVATGLVANQCKIDDESRNAVVEIMNEVVQCIPETNQTFEVAWTPIAQAHVNKLIADGKIDAGQGALIMAAFNVVVKGIDYIFEIRYPKAKQYKELVIAAVDGFSDGFLAVFKPVNVEACSARVVDLKAYDWLRENALK